SPPSPTLLYTLSLHDALPICGDGASAGADEPTTPPPRNVTAKLPGRPHGGFKRTTTVMPTRSASAVLLGHSPAHRAGNCFLLRRDRKSTRLNSSHVSISYAVF